MNTPNYINANTVYDLIGLIRYFDALSLNFYIDLFTHFIPDDDTFSDSDMQSKLVDIFSSSPTFKMYKSQLINECSVFENNGCRLTYIDAVSSIQYLKIEVGGHIFERRFAS